VLVASLSAAQKAGIAGMGAAFIVFALLSSLVLPRYRPDFPGKRGVGPYVALAFCFFAAMMAVIVFVGREKSEAKAEGGTTSAPTAPAPPPPAPGNAAVGKRLFAANGCGSCHTFTPAGSRGTVGPDLDRLASDAKVANRGSVQQYAFESIHDPNAYIRPGFSAGVMPDFGASLTTAQIDDLVAFLTQPS